MHQHHRTDALKKQRGGGKRGDKKWLRKKQKHDLIKTMREDNKEKDICSIDSKSCKECERSYKQTETAT